MLLTHKNTQFSQLNPVPQGETSKRLFDDARLIQSNSKTSRKMSSLGDFLTRRRQAQLNTVLVTTEFRDNSTEECMNSLSSRNMEFKATTDQSKAEPKKGSQTLCETRKKAYLPCHHIVLDAFNAAHDNSKRMLFQQEEQKVWKSTWKLFATQKKPGKALCLIVLTGRNWNTFSRHV